MDSFPTILHSDVLEFAKMNWYAINVDYNFKDNSSVTQVVKLLLNHNLHIYISDQPDPDQKPDPDPELT